MNGLISFWSYALAAALFLALSIWRLGAGTRAAGHRLLIGGFAVTACWAWLAAIDPGSPMLAFAETGRNLVWVGVLYSLSVSGDGREHGVRLVYGAVAAVIGMQLVADSIMLLQPGEAVRETALLLRITTAAGALVLVHNLYGQAAPASRSSIRFAMLGLALLWTYDLNLYTLALLDPATAPALLRWRGVAVALTGPFLALGAGREDGWRIRLSRAATFQSLSLLAICGYFAVMAILATALRGSHADWLGSLLVGALTVTTIAAMVLLPSGRARSWAKVKLAKHLFEHRYDYRTEWLRFTDTLGRAGGDAPPLGERIVNAFADIADAPGGLLLVADAAGAVTPEATWNWIGRTPLPGGLDSLPGFWEEVGRRGRIVEFDGLRHGWSSVGDRMLIVPGWMLDDERIWAGIPLIHQQRLVGLVLLLAPDYRRALDWEDFDLLRTAGRQAASSLAEAHGQAALSNAQRFEEFNRRFAFILHDIKNLVSQLSLLSRNAERHAGNAEFRADMVATLKGSVGKMNDLLARLSPDAGARSLHAEAQPLHPVLAAAVAAKRRSHDVLLVGDAQLWATIDAPALEQAVGHLLQNAIDSSPADEPVTLRVTGIGGSIAIAIIDRGCGMDGDFVRNRLFQPFASTKESGFGIGSFEARSLITAMGGQLAVDSRPEEGSTFTIVLPAAVAAAGADQALRKRA